MFLFAFAVPALLVVIVGYVAGYAVAQWLCDLVGAEASRTPEIVGWATGLVLLAAVLRLLVGAWRRRQEGAHQK